MSEQNNREVRKWVGAYYFGRAFAGVLAATNYSERMLMKALLITCGFMAISVLLVVLFIKGFWAWICFGAFFAIQQIVFAHYRRKRDGYWKQNVPSGEVLEKQIAEVMQVFISFTPAEKEKVLRLIALSRDKATTREMFQKALEEAMQSEGLKSWHILQEIKDSHKP